MSNTFRVSIPVSGSLLREFRRVCDETGRTFEDTIRHMMLDYVADKHGPVQLPGMRFSFEEGVK